MVRGGPGSGKTHIPALQDTHRQTDETVIATSHTIHTGHIHVHIFIPNTSHSTVVPISHITA